MTDRLMTETKSRTANRSDKITKRTVTAAHPEAARYVVWDTDLKGFALRVEPSGAKSYLVRYRVTGGAGRGQRQLTLGRHGPLTPDEARRRAVQALAAASTGVDPLVNRRANRDALTLKELAGRFLSEHVEKKRKPKTAAHYRWALEKYVLPSLGHRKAIDLRDTDLIRLHQGLSDTPYLANRVIAITGSMYAWAVRRALLPEGCNPVRRIEKYAEQHRERFLTRDELDRLGGVLRAGETIGFPRVHRGDKRAPKSDIRDIVSLYAAAAIRLLLFTGARVGEILSLRWSHVDFEREALRLPDSKTGAKVIHLNAPALAVLAGLPRIEGNPYVIVGAKTGEHLHDLKNPWHAICAAAELTGVRLHDLRHTFASYGAASNLGLPVIGKLLGHSQASTTARYAHLADDPARRASRSIADAISSAMGEPAAPSAEVVRLKR